MVTSIDEMETSTKERKFKVKLEVINFELPSLSISELAFGFNVGSIFKRKEEMKRKEIIIFQKKKNVELGKMYDF